MTLEEALSANADTVFLDNAGNEWTGNELLYQMDTDPTWRYGTFRGEAIDYLKAEVGLSPDGVRLLNEDGFQVGAEPFYRIKTASGGSMPKVNLAELRITKSLTKPCPWDKTVTMGQWLNWIAGTDPTAKLTFKHGWTSKRVNLCYLPTKPKWELWYTPEGETRQSIVTLQKIEATFFNDQLSKVDAGRAVDMPAAEARGEAEYQRQLRSSRGC